MKSEYVKSIETRLRWMRQVDDWKDWQRFFHDNALHKEMEVAHDIYETVLKSGDTYFMNKHFCRMVDGARNTVPDDFRFESTWPLSRIGWVWLEEPADLPMHIKMDGKMIPNVLKLQAIGWVRLEDEGVLKNAYSIVCFVEMNDGEFCPWSYFTLVDGELLTPRMHLLEESFSSKPSGAMVSCYPEGRETDIKHELRWVYCALYLMAQKLAHHSHVQPDRATRRRLEQAKTPAPPEIIRVISLRRLEEERPKQPQGASVPVDWHWQWEVVGHWRNQYYPSEETWRQKWIESYVKGPEDKPLKNPGLKLFVARR